MSLLDRGPHTLLVQLMKADPNDRYGGSKKVADGAPVTVTGAMVQPLTTTEAYELGVRADSSWKVICRSWPGGPYSEATWNGRKLFQRGETREHSSGRTTQHHSAVLVATTAEVK